MVSSSGISATSIVLATEPIPGMERRTLTVSRLRSLMFDQLDRYRFITKQSSETAGKRKFDEHLKIMEAVIGRDTARATELLEQHIRDTAAKAMKVL